MSVWDIVIIVLGVAQIIAIIAVVYVVLRIKNGPIMRAIPPILNMAKNGVRLGGITVASVELLEGRTQSLKAEVAGIAEGIRFGTSLDFGGTVTYRGILGTLGTVRTARGLLRRGLTWLERRKKI